MKRVLTSLVWMVLAGACLFSDAAAFETDAGEANKWDILIENFSPSPVYQVEDISVIPEDSVEPKVSAELEKAIEEAHPLSAVSYDLRTGEVSLNPYKGPEKNDTVETAPSFMSAENCITNVFAGGFLKRSNGKILSVLTGLRALEAVPGPQQGMSSVVYSTVDGLFGYIESAGDGFLIGADLSLREIKSHQLKVVLSNKGEEGFSYPAFPALKRYSDGEWLPCPVKEGGIAVIAILPCVYPGQSKELTYNLPFYYGELAPGDYRAEMLVKRYLESDLLPYQSYRSYLVTCRFSIKEEG